MRCIWQHESYDNSNYYQDEACHQQRYSGHFLATHDKVLFTYTSCFLELMEKHKFRVFGCGILNKAFCCYVEESLWSVC